jgi:hypothetical protein
MKPTVGTWQLGLLFFFQFILLLTLLSLGLQKLVNTRELTPRASSVIRQHEAGLVWSTAAVSNTDDVRAVQSVHQYVFVLLK